MIMVKICGITRLEDALLAASSGASHLGFNFYPLSPRRISEEGCAEIARVLIEAYPGVKRVGVFVNDSLAEIRRIVAACQLDLVQLHGNEPPEMLAELEGKAFKALSGVDQAEFARYGSRTRGVPAGLIDAKVAGTFGGTGVTADWQAARSIASEFPIFLAGGLNPGNVAQAVRLVNPWGVDTASGVELAPGIKDPQKIQKFIESAHAVQGVL